MSDSEPGEYKQNNHRSSGERSRSPTPASRHSGTPAKRRSYSRSRSRSRSYRSRSRSRSYRRRSRSRSYKRSRSPSPRRRSRSPGRRSHSDSRSPGHRRSYTHSRSSKSRSPMSDRKRHIGDRMDPPTGRCLGVFGLSLYTTESDLREVFSRYGYIEKVNIVIDQKTGRSRGFGFVYFESGKDALEAKERANGMELDGRRIRVDFSITKRPHTPTPGVYVGRPTSSSYGPPRRGRQDRGRDDGRRDSRRRSPSPYSRRRSPSPYHRDRSPYRSRY